MFLSRVTFWFWFLLLLLHKWHHYNEMISEGFDLHFQLYRGIHPSVRSMTCPHSFTFRLGLHWYITENKFLCRLLPQLYIWNSGEYITGDPSVESCWRFNRPRAWEFLTALSLCLDLIDLPARSRVRPYTVESLVGRLSSAVRQVEKILRFYFSFALQLVAL